MGRRLLGIAIVLAGGISRGAETPEPRLPGDRPDPSSVARRLDELLAKEVLGAGAKLAPRCDDATFLRRAWLDVVGDVPNSVVWNDGVRDILAWVPGQAGSDTGPVDATENSQVIPDAQAGAAAPMPAEGDAAIVATPNDIASSPYQLNESEVAQPGFNGGGEGGRR